jgi:hypothetical protein
MRHLRFIRISIMPAVFFDFGRAAAIGVWIAALHALQGTL